MKNHSEPLMVRFPKVQEWFKSITKLPLLLEIKRN